MVSVRSLFRIALVGCLVLSTQGLLLIQGTFLLRQDVVIATLCVNRAMPEMACEGKCFLSKQLHEHHEREQERNAASLEVMLAVGSLLPTADVLAAPTSRPHAFSTGPDALLPPWSPDDVFRPPRS